MPCTVRNTVWDVSKTRTALEMALIYLILHIEISTRVYLMARSIMQALESGLLTLESSAACNLLALCLRATAAADADLR